MSLKVIFLSLIFGFVGSAVYIKLFASLPALRIAVISYTEKGKIIPQERIELINARADILAKKGFVIMHEGSLYKYPSDLKIPQTLSENREKQDVTAER